ncbi:MAG: hypothetical protein D6780_03080 [Candidatus Dadabacteria bacterium]|nr:MAG: hypothetical protein D6780_03080 [Candidatus Dadabacteria bacterium]
MQEILGERKNYYRILGVPKDASTEEIREAYIRLKTTIANLNLPFPLDYLDLIYATLSDPKTRKEYDSSLDGIYYWEETRIAPQELVNQFDSASSSEKGELSQEKFDPDATISVNKEQNFSKEEQASSYSHKSSYESKIVPFQRNSYPQQRSFYYREPLMYKESGELVSVYNLMQQQSSWIDNLLITLGVTCYLASAIILIIFFVL